MIDYIMNNFFEDGFYSEKTLIFNLSDMSFSSIFDLIFEKKRRLSKERLDVILKIKTEDLNEDHLNKIKSYSPVSHFELKHKKLYDNCQSYKLVQLEENYSISTNCESCNYYVLKETIKNCKWLVNLLERAKDSKRYT